MKNIITLVAILLLNPAVKAQHLVSQSVVIYQTASAKLTLEKTEVISEFIKFKNTPAYRNMPASAKEMYEDAILFLSRSEQNIYLTEGETNAQSNLNVLNKLLSNNLLKEITRKKAMASVGN